MTERATRIRFLGRVEHHHEALPRIKSPGDTILVYRGCDRSIVMACPDGCGEVLTVNLDERSGKAWERYGDDKHLTLYPSVWRATGCESHFVIWRGHIDWLDGDWWDPPETLLASVFEAIPKSKFESYKVIARHLQELPWDVAAACRKLVRTGKAVEGDGRKRGWFKRRTTKELSL